MRKENILINIFEQQQGNLLVAVDHVNVLIIPYHFYNDP